MKKKFSLLMVALLGIVGLSMAAFRAEANSLLIQFSDAEGNAVELTESFSSGDFKLTRVDTDGKHAIDANNAWFGDANTQVKFTHRLKTGGKSGSKNSLSLTIPAEGKLYICARTGSNNAIDRNLVLTQNEAELYNKVVQESDAVSVAGLDSSDPEKETNVYPIISVEVAAGTVEVTYPTNSLNFYAFEFVPAGSEEPVAETKTVTFVNDQNWEKVYVYAWTTENGTTTEFAGAWPGTEITADAEGNYTWSTTDSPANIIFNNGAGTQTANLAFEDGATYNSAGKVIPGAEKTTFTATFKNSIGWEEIYAYAYTEDAAGLTETLGSWPGTKMTKNEETGVWSISFDAYEAPANIIFNNGNGGDGNQTEDLEFEDGKEYDMFAPVEHNGTEYTVNDHTIWVQAINYVATDTYEVTITSEEEMTGLGGSFWYVNENEGEQLNVEGRYTITHEGKMLTITTTSTSDPRLYTPLYILMPGEVSFNDVVFDWIRIDADGNIVVPATISNYQWATFSSDKALDFTNVSDVKAYIVTGAEGSTLTTQQVEGAVAANTGLVLFSETADTYYIPVAEEGTDYASTNKLVAVTEDTEVSKATDGTNYVLTVQSDKVVFAYIDAVPAQLKKGQSYLHLDIAEGETPAPFLGFDGTGTTGISSVERGAWSVEGCYTLDGRRVAQPTKGIYIYKGKKVKR